MYGGGHATPPKPERTLERLAPEGAKATSRIKQFRDLYSTATDETVKSIQQAIAQFELQGCSDWTSLPDEMKKLISIDSELTEKPSFLLCMNEDGRMEAFWPEWVYKNGRTEYVVKHAWADKEAPLKINSSTISTLNERTEFASGGRVYLHGDRQNKSINIAAWGPAQSPLIRGTEGEMYSQEFNSKGELVKWKMTHVTFKKP